MAHMIPPGVAKVEVEAWANRPADVPIEAFVEQLKALGNVVLEVEPERVRLSFDPRVIVA